MTKVVTLVYRLVEGVLPGDAIMREEMIKVAADFTFVAGKYWRILVILMIHTDMEW